MRELNAAWAVLSDDDKRAAYDAQLRGGGDRSFSAGRHGAATSRPERPFRPAAPRR
jgi:curved DNA-binding protein CbpA